MNISTNNMKLNLSKSKIVEKEDKWIEQDILVPDNMPDAIKIINIIYLYLMIQILVLQKR